MKQFLYLDTDIINSIIDQTEKGLVQSLSDEEVSTETETDSLNASIKGTGTIGGSIVKLAKAEAEKVKEGHNREPLRKAGINSKQEIMLLAFNVIQGMKKHYEQCLLIMMYI